FNHAIQHFKVRHQCVEQLARPRAQLNQIAKPLLLSDNKVIMRSDSAELRQTKKRIARPCQRGGLIGSSAGPCRKFAALWADKDRLPDGVDMRNNIHALQHGMTVVFYEDGYDALADQVDHCLGVVLKEDRFLQMQALERRRHAHAETDRAMLK